MQCRNFNFGLTTKARGLQKCKPKMKLRSHISCSRECRRMWRNEPPPPKWTPLWELEPRWILEFSKSDWRDQNSLHWIIPHIIGKILKLRCLKWTCIIDLNTLNISYGQKKSQKSNCQFDSQPLKVKNFPDLSMNKQCVTYCWKVLDKGYNFASNLILIESLQNKLWASKVARVPI
jgi:hypothetical protein